VSQPHYGGESSAFITALVALLRAQGIPLDEAFERAEGLYRETIRRKGNNTFARSDLLDFLRLIEAPRQPR
jgi:hypothetical protein